MSHARVAIVTGSESGIGRATAVALAGQGCDVGITWFRDEAAAEATAEEVRSAGRRAGVRHLDLTRLPEAADVVDELAEAERAAADAAAALKREERRRAAAQREADEAADARDRAAAHLAALEEG